MTSLIILAAGASTRLGQPKQKLLFHGRSLLQHAVYAGLESKCESIVVVLGANAEAIQAEIAGEPVELVHNPDWEEGMASSIRAGIGALQKITDKAEQVIIMLCDQPFADARLLNSLILKQKETNKKIVASAYNDTLGVPVLFEQSYFQELRSLKGQEGARKLLVKYAGEVASVSFPLGAVDIDTPADYDALKGSQLA